MARPQCDTPVVYFADRLPSGSLTKVTVVDEKQKRSLGVRPRKWRWKTSSGSVTKFYESREAKR
jgi:hypothetical protein